MSLAVGRIVLSAYVGAWALGGGPPRYFAVVAGTMAIVFVALVRRHIEPSPTHAVPTTVSAPATR